MENSFFSGSENLYKYLVSIGILLLVLTIYYPLQQKQDLEILKINLESDLKILNKDIKENKQNVDNLLKHLKDKNIKSDEKRKVFSTIKSKQKENEINEIKTNSKLEEIKNREYYIGLYKNLFWISIIVSIILIVFGFFRWIIAKKNEDKKLDCETKLLELKLKLEQEEYDRTHPET